MTDAEKKELDVRLDKMEDSIDKLTLAILGNQQLNISGILDEMKELKHFIIKYKYMKWLAAVGAATIGTIGAVILFLKELFS
jgi:SMC interacting uncharacterized protein involved in chromosome segregation